jgi:hypothetical protein
MLLENNPAPLSEPAYSLLLRSRILSTRGIGTRLTTEETSCVLNELPSVELWMRDLLKESKIL